MTVDSFDSLTLSWSDFPAESILGVISPIIKGIVALILLVFIIKSIANMKLVVPHGNVVIVERFGKYHSTLQPGLHFILPYIHSKKRVSWSYTMETTPGRSTWSNEVAASQKQYYISYLIPTYEKCFDPPSIKVISKDNMPLDINIVLFYRITDPVKAVYNIQDLYQAIEQVAYTHISSACASVEMEDLIEHRPLLVKNTLEGFNDVQEEWGIRITKIDIQSISPPEDLLKKKALLRSEKIQKEIEHERMKREQEIRTIQAETERKIIMTNLETKVKREKQEADLQFYKTKKEAEGRASSETLLREKQLEFLRELASIDPSLPREMLLQEKRNEAWNLMSQSASHSNGSVMIIPYESAQYIGGATSAAGAAVGGANTLRERNSSSR